MMMRPLMFTLSCMLATAATAGETTEFCLDGEFNLGARLQGTKPDVDEFVPTRWCVLTQDDSVRAVFTASGKSNPDMHGDWTVALLPPDLVRIVNADNPPDIEFTGTNSRSEALRVRRLDPRRLVDEHLQSAQPQMNVTIEDGRLLALKSSVDLPLRGRVPVSWTWDWGNVDTPWLKLKVDDRLFFRAKGSWRVLNDDESQQVWEPTPGVEPVEVAGENWPSRINMRLVDVADRIYLVHGVRTGFQHLAVDTAAGLVVADAPAGWVELHQLPASDLVPGLGISGLSERLVDFLAAEFPGRPIRAVVLTHAHDDHAGGARAFAAAGAQVYAPAKVAAFLEGALNRSSMPEDRLSETRGQVEVIPVSDTVILEDDASPVSIRSIGAGPHGSAALGIHAVRAGYFFVSDIHVPRSDADTPRQERAATECWFARWADAELPSDTIVLNSHSDPQTPVSRLSGYLKSPLCSNSP